MTFNIPRSVLPSLMLQRPSSENCRPGYVNAYERSEELTLGHGIATKELSELKGNEGDERARDSEKVCTQNWYV